MIHRPDSEPTIGNLTRSQLEEIIKAIAKLRAPYPLKLITRSIIYYGRIISVVLSSSILAQKKSHLRIGLLLNRAESIQR